MTITNEVNNLGRHALRDLPFAQCTLPTILSRQADRFTDKPLVTIDGHTFTYRQMRNRAARVAGMLTDQGVSPGARVVTLSGNRVELLELFLGCAWIGAILVPLNVESRREGLRHMLADSEPIVIVAEAYLLDRLQHIDIPASVQLPSLIRNCIKPAGAKVLFFFPVFFLRFENNIFFRSSSMSQSNG